MNERVEILYGKRIFQIELSYTNNKRLSLTVHPDKRIIAKTPRQYSQELIYKRLERKAPWIARQVDFFDQYHPQQPPRKYVSGETHYYLGRQYRLKVHKSELNQVRLIGRYFIVQTSDPANRNHIKQLMQKWFTLHAKSLLTKRLELYCPAFKRWGARYDQIQFRLMQKRWGSCSKTGSIVLNTELVNAPIHSIDYVIVHELCHLIAPNHDKKFYRLLNSILPDWEQRKNRLEKVLL
ncbi:MAG: M48 family metallopeptidase [Calditrichaceae bacterium]|nr:M48 family metallopeptidase [Calditrichaceae bacterium]MBN2707577.1 M48 family metallopeptidase [Calditrichaceae bacterium]RQV95661.1 MAG: M48 family peptidase [Calditrichota bacterium]